MGSINWLNLVIAVLVIIFAAMNTVWLVIVLAAILAILSIFGVCSCCKKSYMKKEVRAAAPRKTTRRRKR